MGDVWIGHAKAIMLQDSAIKQPSQTDHEFVCLRVEMLVRKYADLLLDKVILYTNSCDICLVPLSH